LVRLDPREVGTFTLREAILAVKLELSGDDRVLTPTMHVKRGLREDESSGIRNTRVIQVRSSVVEKSSNIRSSVRRNRNSWATQVRLIVRVRRSVPVSSESGRRNVVKSSSVLEKTVGINVSARVSSNRGRSTESMDGIRKSINGVSVVEGLSSKDLEKKSITGQRRTVVNILIGLDNPDELLNRVVEVELNLVRRRTNRFITSELELSNEVLMRVLCHSAALISIQKDVVNIERSSNQRLIVSNGGRNWASNRVLAGRSSVRIGVAVKSGNSPETLINRTNIKVDLDLVVLESN